MIQGLRHGDRSHQVRKLQEQLNSKGAELILDGHFDDATRNAVRAYQLNAGLVADGIAGPKTLSSLSGMDCANLLSHSDLCRAAAQLDLPLAAVYAVNEVESLGNGFLPDGRPTVLFERHVMYRQLCSPRNGTERKQDLKRHADQLAIVHPNLVNPKPGGYGGGKAEYERLSKACLIDDNSALESASWGAFQIMGFHWRRLGYSDVQSFVKAMHTNESEQFTAFVSFVKTDTKLHDALKAQNWTAFARWYNGQAYARNRYDIRLKDAFERYTQCSCGDEVEQ